MAYCTNCGGELFETSKFCPHCGTPVLEMAKRSDDAKPKEYDTKKAADDVEGLPEVNTGVLTPEEQAAVLEMAVENVLEDIPDIKKLDGDELSVSQPDKTPEAPAKEEVHKEEAPKPEPKKPAEEKKEEKISEPEKVSEPQPETVNIPAEPKKKGKVGIIAVIAILIAAAAGGAVFFMSRGSQPVNNTIEQTEVTPELTITTEAETVPEISETEVSETEVSSELTAVNETELSSETDMSSETVSESEVSAEEAVSEIVSETVSETVLSQEYEGEEMYTAESLAAGIIIEPEHQLAMGSNISAEISLSGEGVSTAILSSGVLFLAEYTTTASAPANLTPAAMVITIGDTTVEVTATSSSEKMVIFEYDVMTAAVEAAGFTAADIDKVSIKSTGVPIDVFRITILQE